ncbi:uncharacterized protein RG961_005814 isoform 2-T2 [Leptosomus discolor]
MEVCLAGGFLPLLLLTWLPAGVTHQIPGNIDVLVQLDLVLQCLLQTDLSSTAGEMKGFNSTQNNGEKQSEGGVELKKGSAQLIFTCVNKAYTGASTCRVENTRITSKIKCVLFPAVTVSQPEESDITMECMFKICSGNLTVCVKLYKPAGLEVRNRTNTMALGENCTNLTSPGRHAANTGICECGVIITSTNLTVTGNSMQGTVPSCGPRVPQTSGTKDTWPGLHCLLCATFGLAVGTLLYMPIIGVLLWQCRRNRKGKLTSRQMVEGNQLSMAAPVTGTEDLTYANLKFEKNGTKPTSSDIVYTEIKPSQQKQSSRDASAANTGVDVSSKGEGK